MEEYLHNDQEQKQQLPKAKELTPREIVAELDKHIVGPVSYTHLDVYKRQMLPALI